MSFKVPDVIEEYLKIIEEGQYRVCKEQKALAEYVRKVFKEEPIVFDEEKAKLEKYTQMMEQVKERLEALKAGR